MASIRTHPYRQPARVAIDNPVLQKALYTFRSVVDDLASQWLVAGLPSRQGLDEAADELACLREHLKIQGLWKHRPSMVTATLDDGLGQGLAVIEKYGASIGLRLISLGLMQSPAAVIDACRRHQPDYLGLTILQFDTEEDLIAISKKIPRKTRIVAGGPVFAGDPNFAGRTGTHFAAKNVAHFLRFMLDAAC